MAVWYWSPQGMSETLEFGTEVKRSTSAEARVSYKDATQRLSYNFTVSPAIAEEMIDIFRSDPDQVFLVPEWPTATVDKASTIAASTTVITVADEAAYAVGQAVYIGNPGGLWEQAEVLSTAPGQITLTAGTSAEYVGSTPNPLFIAPMQRAIVPDGLQFASRFPVRDLSVEFLCIDPVDLAANPYTTFGGLPVVSDALVPFSALQGSGSQASILADSGFGAYEIIATEDFERRGGQLSFFAKTYADRFTQRRFFHFMRGRDGEMWVPTGQRDLVLNSGFSSSALTLSVKPIASAARMVGKSILVSEGANSAAREVTAATDVSATVQTLEISALGFTGTTDACISLLHRSRFDVDVVPIEYEFTPSGLHSRSAMPVIEVP